MGPFLGKPSAGRGYKTLPPLLLETQVFALWTLADVKEVMRRLRTQIFGFSLISSQFECVVSFRKDVTTYASLDTIFEILDNDNDGRIDGLELVAGLVLVCRGSFEEKVKVLFEAFDFNLNSQLGKSELSMMITSCVCGVIALTGGGEDSEPSLEYFDEIIEEAFIKADRDANGIVSYDEFVQWARSNRAIMSTLDTMQRINLEQKDKDAEDSADEADEEYMSDSEIHDPRKAMKTRSVVIDEAEHGRIIELSPAVHPTSVQPHTVKDPFGRFHMLQWQLQVADGEPTDMHLTAALLESPDSDLKLSWVHGMYAECRNCVKYISLKPSEPPTLIVYISASLVILRGIKDNSQRFYQRHKTRVSCLAVHPKMPVVASGDFSSAVHIWDAVSLACLSCIQVLGNCGLQQLAFSPTEDRIASVSMDPDHTVNLHDTTSGAVVGSGKGFSAPNNVLGLAYSTSGDELVIVGKKKIRFFKGLNNPKRDLGAVEGIVGHVWKKRTYFCAVYVGNDVVVGCCDGSLYRFSGQKCVQVVQAHTINDPVLCVVSKDGILVTGGKDGLVKSWDSTFKEIGATLDISEDLDGDGRADSGSLNPVITSVDIFDNRILVGTKGADIFDVEMPRSTDKDVTLTRIASGHYKGELWGLSAHPIREEFATCGDDRTLRVWSFRTQEQLALRTLPEPARVVMYGPKGDIMALGMQSGAVALIDTSSSVLRVYSTWADSNCTITSLRFSVDGRFLAVGSSDKNIYVYLNSEKRLYKKYSICRGHNAAVNHIDFSQNSQYIRSNGIDKTLLLWEIRGNQVRSPSDLRDTVWASHTCTMTWAVQGLWSKTAGNPDYLINACQAQQDLDVVISGDSTGAVNLHHFPQPGRDSLHQIYLGHSGPVSNVTFSGNRRFAVSIGELDRAIMVWNHEIEDYDSDKDENEEDELDTTPIELMFTGVNLQKDSDEIYEKPSSTVKNAWKKSTVEPIVTEKVPVGTTDVDLVLQWVHGFRSFDCKNNLRYTAAGEIVFHAAAVAIVYSKSQGSQRFLQGSHFDDIISFSMHPSGQLCATGDKCVSDGGPRIVIWNTVDMTVTKALTGDHSTSIIMLSFNAKGNLLVSIGDDALHTMVVHDWQTGTVLARTPTDKFTISSVIFLAETAKGPDAITILTASSNNIKFWALDGPNVRQQKAIWGKNRRASITAISSAGGNISFMVSSKGKIYVAKDYEIVYPVVDSGHPKDSEPALLTPSPHNCPINAIFSNQILASSATVKSRNASYPHRYITGDESGIVAIWRLNPAVDPKTEDPDNPFLVLTDVFSLTNLGFRVKCLRIQSVCERDGVLLIGTKGNDVLEIEWDISSWEHKKYAYVSSLTSTAPVLEEVKADPRLASTAAPAVAGGGATSASGGLEVAKSGPAGETESSLVPAASMVIPGGGSIVETKYPTLVGQRVSSSHFAEEVWGLAAHPKAPLFYTSGDDGTFRVWSLKHKDHRLISYVELPTKSRAVAISGIFSRGALKQSSPDIAVAMSSGEIWIFDSAVFTLAMGLDILGNPLGESSNSSAACRIGDCIEPEVLSRFSGVVCRLHDARMNIDVMKYSPVTGDGSFLAVGCYDGNIYLYSVDKMYSLHLKLSGHTSHMKYLDFGVFVDRASGESYNEIKGEISLPATSKVTEVGSVGASLSSSSPSSVRPVAPSDLCLMSASGDAEVFYWLPIKGEKLGSLTLARNVQWATITCPYNWAAQGVWSEESTKNSYIVNAIARNNYYKDVAVLAASDDQGIVRLYNFPCVEANSPEKSYRGHSATVTNICFSFDDAYCISTGGDDQCVFVWSTDVQEELRARIAVNRASGGATSNSTSKTTDYEESFTIAQSKSGDQFGAVKPWKGSIREPTTYIESPAVGTKPEDFLELKHVYGYRGWDCRNNIAFANSCEEVVYHVAAIGVIFNSELNTQVHNIEHNDDILCLAVHPLGHTVATGQVGKTPKLVVWDASTGMTLQTIMFHSKGISQVAFTMDGNSVISVGMDDDRMIAVHNATSGILLGKGKVGKGMDIYSLSAGPDFFVTCGKNLVKFWDIPNIDNPVGELSSKTGIFAKTVKSKSAVSVAFLGSDAVTGLADGNLLLWKARSSAKMELGHSDAVTAMCTLAGSSRIASGGKDGKVCIWSNQLVKLAEFCVNEFELASRCPQVQALNYREGRLIVGTRGCEIYELDIGIQTPDPTSTSVLKLVDGHNDKTTGSEVWGIAAHPKMSIFATASDDLTVRIWDSRSKQMKVVFDLPAKARTLDFCVDGNQLAVGLMSGKVMIFNPAATPKSAMIAEAQVTKKAILTVRYSPNGSLLAVATQDFKIFLLDTTTYGNRAVLNGHHAGVTHVDFSADGSILQSVSHDYELLFWNTSSGKQIKSPSDVRDVKWGTFTSILGWSVQGIWPPDADGTDVNSVCRSPDESLLATGDDFGHVKLFRYPCPKEKSQFRQYRGHSSHVCGVTFSSDGKFLFSVGGLDKSILQFEVKRPVVGASAGNNR